MAYIDSGGGLSPEREDFPDSYCLFCCHFHDCDQVCDHYSDYGNSLINDWCSCSSSLEDREKAWDEVLERRKQETSSILRP